MGASRAFRQCQPAGRGGDGDGPARGDAVHLVRSRRSPSHTGVSCQRQHAAGRGGDGDCPARGDAVHLVRSRRPPSHARASSQCQYAAGRGGDGGGQAVVLARPSCWCVYVDVCRGVAMRCTWCDRAGHQVTPGHRASASMQRVEAVMVTAQLVAMRCTWCDHAGAWSVSCFSLLPLSFFMCARSNRAS